MLTCCSMVLTEMMVTIGHGNCFLKGIQFSVWGAQPCPRTRGPELRSPQVAETTAICFHPNASITKVRCNQGLLKSLSRPRPHSSWRPCLSCNMWAVEMSPDMECVLPN